MKYWMIMLGVLVFWSCTDDEMVYSPKPRMYPKVDFPTPSYKSFDEFYCDFTFDQPAYTKVVQDTSYGDQRSSHACWFDLYFPPFNAEINFSYYPISPVNTLDVLIADAFELASKHNIKADYIEENYIKNKFGTTGLVFKLDGPVASPIQFYMTDSTRHFVRGSLYFNSKVNYDSLAPILDFVDKEMTTITSTFQWIDHE